MKLILASTSKRRRDLLKLLGVKFREVGSRVAENKVTARNPKALAIKLAKLKAATVARRINDGIIMAADTIVIDNKKALGKPANKIEAISMLMRLRGRAHHVITALAIHGPRRMTASVVTKVQMRPYSLNEVLAYVHSGKSKDKAGSYGIQDKAFHPVERVNGCACNVMGLPLQACAGLLKKAKIKIKPSRAAIGKFCRRCFAR